MQYINEVFRAMVAHEAGNPHRIQHFVKVHGFAVRIAEMEGMDAEMQQVLEIAALVHDIGIKPALAQYGSAEGPLQERLGPPVAAEMLASLGVPANIVERVCFLVGHHHSYADIQSLDHQILVEADFLVNFHEGEMDPSAIRAVLSNVFATEVGAQICREMFGV